MTEKNFDLFKFVLLIWVENGWFLVYCLPCPKIMLDMDLSFPIVIKSEMEAMSLDLSSYANWRESAV